MRKSRSHRADAHLLCIGKKQPRQAGVKEDLLSGSFQEEREPGLATVIVLHEGGIINKNGEGETGRHGGVFCNGRYEPFLFCSADRKRIIESQSSWCNLRRMHPPCPGFSAQYSPGECLHGSRSLIRSATDAYRSSGFLAKHLENNFLKLIPVEAVPAGYNRGILKDCCVQVMHTFTLGTAGAPVSISQRSIPSW